MAPSPVTAVELRDRLRRVRADVEVVGIEIDPERVAAAAALAGDGLSFRVGGFEVPLEHGERPIIVRAFNVLRQYDEVEVPAHWHLVCSRLAPDGLFVDGTCDEIGRRASWIALTPAGPSSASRCPGASRASTGPPASPSASPKALIHRNVPGEARCTGCSPTSTRLRARGRLCRIWRPASASLLRPAPCKTGAGRCGIPSAGDLVS